MQIVTKVELRQKVWIYKKKCDILLDKERDNMRKVMVISILCAVILSACGNVSETAETSEVSQTTTTLTTSAATAKEEKYTSETTATIKKSSQTVSSSPKPTDTEVTAVKKSSTSNTGGNSVQGQNNAVQGNNQAVQNNTPSNNSQDNNLAKQNAQPSNEKHQNNEPSATRSTTAKPSASAEPAVTNSPVTTTKPQTTVPQTEPPAPEPTEEERYMDIGRSLSHNGSDYSKAEAVYNWMTENGSGTCVNYSWQTYYLCKGTGLECYLAWTPSKLYGHVANVVKVNGTWFVLDTQGQGFLLNNDCGFSEIIDIDESYVSVADLISNQRYDEIY